MSTVSEYQDALREFEKCKAEAKQASVLIGQVRDILNSDRFPHFLGWAFNITNQIEPGRQLNQQANIDLSAWPTRDDMKSIFARWASSLSKLKTIWGALPEDNRIGLSEPPARLDLRY